MTTPPQQQPFSQFQSGVGDMLTPPLPVSTATIPDPLGNPERDQSMSRHSNDGVPSSLSLDESLAFHLSGTFSKGLKFEIILIKKSN